MSLSQLNSCTRRRVSALCAQDVESQHKTSSQCSLCTRRRVSALCAQDVESQHKTPSQCSLCTRRQVTAQDVESLLFVHKTSSQCSLCTRRQVTAQDVESLHKTSSQCSLCARRRVTTQDVESVLSVHKTSSHNTRRRVSALCWSETLLSQRSCCRRTSCNLLVAKRLTSNTRTNSCVTFFPVVPATVGRLPSVDQYDDSDNRFARSTTILSSNSL